MASRLFECENCGAFGKIALKGDELDKTDIAYCPVCSADISEDDKEDSDPEE